MAEPINFQQPVVADKTKGLPKNKSQKWINRLFLFLTILTLIGYILPSLLAIISGGEGGGWGILGLIIGLPLLFGEVLAWIITILIAKHIAKKSSYQLPLNVNNPTAAQTVPVAPSTTSLPNNDTNNPEPAASYSNLDKKAKLSLKLGLIQISIVSLGVILTIAGIGTLNFITILLISSFIGTLGMVVALTGIIFGFQGLKSNYKTKAITGIVLSSSPFVILLLGGLISQLLFTQL